MADALPSRHPVYAIRTLGGIYRVTHRDWDKVCELRDSRVPAEVRLAPHAHPIEELCGTDFRRLNTIVTKPIALDDLTPGLHRYRLHRRGFGEWVTTSPVVAVYAGTFTKQITRGADHLVLARDQAWFVAAEGDRSRRLFGSGWDGAERPIDPVELLAALPGAIVIQINEAKLPETPLGDLAELLPGWETVRLALTAELAELGVLVRAVLFDRWMSGLPEFLLSEVRADDAGVPDPRVSAAVERYYMTCQEICQHCAAAGVELVRVPSPYLLEYFQLCAACRALKLTAMADAMTPAGGFTPLLTPGAPVTVWRSATGLHLATPDGYAGVAELRNRWREPRLPMPRWLELPELYAEVCSLASDINGRRTTRDIDDPAATLPGMRIGVLLSDSSSPEFTALDVFHGTAVIGVDDEHTFLIYQAGATVRDRAWLLEHGKASRLLAGGWDALPDLHFDLDRLLAGRRGEVGVIRLDRIQQGASGGRAGFDAFAPGWTSHLDQFLEAIAREEYPPRLTHADVSPLTGEPIVRLAGVLIEGRWANEPQLRQHARALRAACLSSCAICGEPGRLTTLPSRERHGSVRRCLCLTHQEEEDQKWTD